MTAQVQHEESSARRWLPWLWVGLVILLSAYVRFRLRDLPLERDEGEYAYAGQLILQGIPPYELAYNMKWPGTYAAYAALMAVFGETAAGIHVGLIVVNALSIVLMFLLGRKLFGETVGAVAAVAFGVLSLSPQVLGVAAHATHFVVLFELAGFWIFFRARESGRWQHYFGSGLLLGTALLMKQHGAVFGALAILVLWWTERARMPRVAPELAQRMGGLVVGLILPFVFTSFVLWLAGVFETFVFWTFSYARHYATMAVENSIWERFADGVRGVSRNQIGLWVLAGLGLVALRWEKRPVSDRWFVVGLLGCSLVAICPGFHFRPHYFILLLPALALLIGVAVAAGKAWLLNRGKPALAWMSPAAFGAIVILTILSQKTFFFELTPVQACRAIYFDQLFPESVEIARYLKAHTVPGAKIAVIGSEPQVYFYAGRHSATGYLYTYALMEKHPYASQMQRQMIQEIEANEPAYLIYFGGPDTWSRRDDSDTTIFRWFGAYNQRFYELDGVAEAVSMTQTEYRWGADARTYRPQGTQVALILKRKAAP